MAAALTVTGAPALVLPEATAASTSVGWLHTSGSKIVTTANQQHVVKAVNWFGLETENCAPHGLWSINLDAGLKQIAGMGFNTVRLPYSNQCIRGAAVSGVDTSKNPQLANKTPLQIMDIVIQRAEAHGLSVILDRHRPGSAAQSDLWYTAAYTEKMWIDDWVMLAKRYASSPTVVGADLHNEPAGAACWGCGNAATDWAAAAQRAGNAVLAANPKLLVVVEGVEKQGNGEYTWWGAGLSDVAARPLKLSVPNRVVYSPHEYPESVYPQKWFSAPDYPANLPGQWDRTWGYLQRTGTAPILVGEFGTKLETASDAKWLDTFVGYLRASSTSFTYWSFNPNSVDTGGLLKDDWVTPQTAKLTRLAPILTPGATATTTKATATATATATAPAPTVTPTATGSPATATSAAMSAGWKLQSSWDGGYVAHIDLSAGDSPRTGWSLRWSDPKAVAVRSAWGMSCAVTSGTVVCKGADWGSTLAAGSTTTVGLQLDTLGRGQTAPTLVLG